MLVRLIKTPITTIEGDRIPAINPSVWEIGATYLADYGTHYKYCSSKLDFFGKYCDVLDADCFEPLDDEAKEFYNSPDYKGEGFVTLEAVGDEQYPEPPNDLVNKAFNRTGLEMCQIDFGEAVYRQGYYDGRQASAKLWRSVVPEEAGQRAHDFFAGLDNRDGTFAFDPNDARDIDALVAAILKGEK